ncbi:MAG: ABC transporter permease [Ruminococcus sp.]|jgi:ABC-2 type transport system permease protein
MRGIIKNVWKDYLKNPLLWIGMVLVLAGVYQTLEPYLNIRYFHSDQEIEAFRDSSRIDAYVSEGWIPATPEKQRRLWEEEIRDTLISYFGLSEDRAEDVIRKTADMDIEEACRYLEEKYQYYNTEYTYEDCAYYQGTAREVNAYLDREMAKHRFSWYFSRKFADFAGLYLIFFASVILAFLYLWDTRKNTYELLHTKPIEARQYILGKAAGGLLILFFVLAILTAVFFVLCALTAQRSGFAVSVLDFLYASAVYILPNLVMIVAVYTFIAMVFRNPLPAVPLLILYVIYSNMGSVNAQGEYVYSGRPLAVMVRFPGAFFDTAPPSMVIWNQAGLLAASVILLGAGIRIWKRRRYS